MKMFQIIIIFIVLVLYIVGSNLHIKAIKTELKFTV